MDQAVRLLILMFVVISLIYIFSHQPRPVVEAAVIPYCEIEFRTAIKDRRGIYHFSWGGSWGPCSLSDRYEDA